MKLLLIRFKYLILSVVNSIIPNQRLTKKKLIIGGVIIGMLAVSSCRVIPRTCYKPAPPSEPEQTETDETNTE